MPDQLINIDVMVIGAGAAGLMAAGEALKRGRSVIIIDHAHKPAEKIRISGGGRCNFTHLDSSPKNFISQNPAFCISALKRFTPHDFLLRVMSNNIAYVEKAANQLFCERSAQDIINMLLKDIPKEGLALNSRIQSIEKSAIGFTVITDSRKFNAQSLIVACGGLSIPKMGATGLAYEIAKQFGHNIIPTRAGLVPFCLESLILKETSSLSGLSLTSLVKVNKTSFEDGFLYTHRGLSGPAVLQASSYWLQGDMVQINLCPNQDVMTHLTKARQEQGKLAIVTSLSHIAPRRFVEYILNTLKIPFETQISQLKGGQLTALAHQINKWEIIPSGTEGYRTAEVTIGGIDTKFISSQTMGSHHVKGLYFIGECLDVTGHLGGHNFQWAWSSGWAAGQVA